MNTLLRQIFFPILLLITIPMMGQQQKRIVGFGETFESIANMYEISLEELLNANPGKTYCYAGMEIVIPQPQINPIGKSDITSPVIIYADSLLFEAKALASSAQYKKAIKIYNKIIDMKVRTPYAYSGRGECYYNLKNYKSAKKDLLTAINSGQLAMIEKDWCEDALEDVEKELQAKRERRAKVWSNIGLTFAAAAAVTAATYAASEQAKMQNQRFQNPVPRTNPNLSQSDAAIAQTTAWEKQWRANNTAQLNQMTQNFLIQGKIQAEENSRQYVENMAKTRELIQSQARMQTEFAFKKLNKWEEEFEKNAGRKPTEDEIDNYCKFNIPELYEARMQTRGMMGNSQPISIENDIKIDEKNEYKGELSPEQYKASYRKWEQYAQDAVKNLTFHGYVSKDKKGNMKGTSNHDYVNGLEYLSNQKMLHTAQHEMQKIRHEAEKYGVYIPQSSLETTNVSY